ncbi:MAG TPA: hypothetical protein VFL36_17160 [Myxococcales bacterium]|nr:hypothetical protein [Myxococcales bacterium]
MKIRRFLQAAGVVQLVRFAAGRRRRVLLRRRRRRGALGALGLLAFGTGAWWALARRERTPAWQRKKLRKQARREAARREREQAPAKPQEVHFETEADPSLRVRLEERK